MRYVVRHKSQTVLRRDSPEYVFGGANKGAVRRDQSDKARGLNSYVERSGPWVIRSSLIVAPFQQSKYLSESLHQFSVIRLCRIYEQFDLMLDLRKPYTLLVAQLGRPLSYRPRVPVVKQFPC